MSAPDGQSLIVAHSDSEDEAVDDLDFDRTTEADADEDADVDDDILDPMEGDAAAEDATEGDEESPSDDSEDGSEDNDDEQSEQSGVNPSFTVEGDHPSSLPLPGQSRATSTSSRSRQSKDSSPSPATHTRSLSPAQLRKMGLFKPPSNPSRSYTVEAICALPHPAPTHALASSLCMSHLLTGSEDGYIRDYNIFAAVNGKNFLTAPQRHHCGVVEGIMKAGQIRCWWENPAVKPNNPAAVEEDLPLSPVYSLLMHTDALWALAGTKDGHINLFTVRHEPGRFIHVLNGHTGPVSALAMEHDEKGFFSAGWDGEALQWDLNTGQTVRRFTAHGAQLAALAVRPASTPYHRVSSPPIASAAAAPPLPPPPAQEYSSSRSGGSRETTLTDSSATMGSGTTMYQAPMNTAVLPAVPQTQDADSKSDASFDPLFDDEPDADGESDNVSQMNGRGVSGPGGSLHPMSSNIAMPLNSADRPSMLHPTGRGILGIVAPPKNAPPLLNSSAYATYSPDLLMTASIDGQVILWDKRVHTPGRGVGRLEMSEKTPPWCVSACWSADGSQVYAGRRIGTVDVWDVRQYGRSGVTNTPRLVRTLRNPPSSGVVSCVVAFPDSRHIACASNDNIRLWNAAESNESDGFGKPRSGVQFKIIPGHHGGYISQMLVDVGARFLVCASSNRGWHGDSTRTVFVHEIKHV